MKPKKGATKAQKPKSKVLKGTVAAGGLTWCGDEESFFLKILPQDEIWKTMTPTLSCLVIALLLGLVQRTWGNEGNATCISSGSCQTCIQSTGVGAGGETVNCLWCSSNQLCVPSSSADSYCSHSEQLNTCDNSYYTIIFIVISFALLCLCLATCYMKKLHRRSGRRALNMLPAAAREFLYRNSLLGEGKSEWMCIICGFDNKPTHDNCILCGTSHKFSTDYKQEKKRMLERSDDKLMSNRDRENQHGGSTQGSKYQSTMSALVEAINADGYTGEGGAAPTTDDSSSYDIDRAKGSLSRNQSFCSVQSAASTSIIMEPVSPTRISLSQKDREEAFNYRRLNQLSLRQKSARRRRMWQRVPDKKSGELKWVRTLPTRTKVGNAPFGYTPQGSVRESSSSSSLETMERASDRDERQGSDSCCSCLTKMLCCCCVPSKDYNPRRRKVKKSRRQLSFSGDDDDYDEEESYEEEEDDDEEDLMERGIFRDSKQTDDDRPPVVPPIGADHTGTSGNPLQEPLLSSLEDSNTASTTSGKEKTKDKGQKRRKQRKERGYRSSSLPVPIPIDRFSVGNSSVGGRQDRRSVDSFGDSVVMSSSPGFTSVFDAETGVLQWRKVEDGAPALRSVFPARTTEGIGSSAGIEQRGTSSEAAAGAGGVRDDTDTDSANETAAAAAAKVCLENDEVAVDALLTELEQEDLVSVAALSFMEKQLWFLRQLDKLQVPYRDGCIRMEIRRNYLLLDTVVLVGGLTPRDMHKWWRMQFAGEAGIDAGGLEREWFSLVAGALFDPEAGLFTTPTRSNGGGGGGASHINPTSADSKKDHLQYFKVAGRMLGKALMEQQTLNAPLSLPLRKMLLNIPITFSDLEFCDPALYRSLLYVRDCPSDEVEMLSLDFTVAYPTVQPASGDVGGNSAEKMRTMELKPDGANIAVTADTREEYLQLMLSNRMLTSIQSQVEWLLRGFYEVVPPDLLSVFDYQELDLLLCGIPEISVEDWRRHTEYLGIYHENHRNIKWFWNFVEGCGPEERARLLQFITGASRLPPQGFKALISNDGNHRRFNIQSISRKDSIYPRSHTCFNKLDLPLYSSQEELDAFVSCVLGEAYGFTID